MEERHDKNCFIEVLKHWFYRQLGVEVPDVFLYIIFGSLNFHYSSRLEDPSHIFPKVDLIQPTDETNLEKWLGLKTIWHDPVTSERGWNRLEPLLMKGQNPIVRVAVHMLPDLEASQTVTFMSINQYLPEESAVDVFSTFYSGRLSLEKLDLARREIVSFSLPECQWLELSMMEMPVLDHSYLERIFLAQLQADLAKGYSAANFEKMIADLLLVEGLNPLLAKLYIACFGKHMFHPKGPASVRREMLSVMHELQKGGTVSEETVVRYEVLCQQWDILKMMFAKAGAAPKQMVERLIERVRTIAALEQEVFDMMRKQVKVG
ncbi:hypothetical protein FB479_1189 [Brevibacillus sp. AG162]|nr:hypothetical protein FB479_1189 [Brevibacillus sp. AG162]